MESLVVHPGSAQTRPSLVVREGWGRCPGRVPFTSGFLRLYFDTRGGEDSVQGRIVGPHAPEPPGNQASVVSSSMTTRILATSVAGMASRVHLCATMAWSALRKSARSWHGQHVTRCS